MVRILSARGARILYPLTVALACATAAFAQRGGGPPGRARKRFIWLVPVQYSRSRR